MLSNADSSTSTTEETTTVEAYDPTREQEGIKASIRSCLSCKHVNKCKFFELESAHQQRLEEVIKRSNFPLDLIPAESLGSRCGDYESNVTLDV